MVIVPPNSPLHRRANESDITSAVLEPRWKYGDVAVALKLAQVLKKDRIDIVIIMRSQDIHLASIAKRFFPAVQLVFYQQMDSQYNKRDLFHSWTFSALSLWVTLTQSMKDHVLSFTKMPGEKVSIVPLGIDIHQFNPQQFKKEDARSAFDLPQGKKIIGVLGRLDPGKGQETAIRAIAEIVKHYADIVLVIAGDETAGEPGYKAYLETLCRTLHIEQYVRFLPFTEDVPRFLSALDVFTLPSYGETFGLVVIEAMAMGKTIIATNAGGVPEIISDGHTGLLIEPRNIDACVSAIKQILDNKDLALSLGQTARKDALKRFSMDSCVNALMDLLKNL